MPTHPHIQSRIGEPTESVLAKGHKGIVKFRVEVTGKAGKFWWLLALDPCNISGTFIRNHSDRSGFSGSIFSPFWIPWARCLRHRRLDRDPVYPETLGMFNRCHTLIFQLFRFPSLYPILSNPHFTQLRTDTSRGPTPRRDDHEHRADRRRRSWKCHSSLGLRGRYVSRLHQRRRALEPDRGHRGGASGRQARQEVNVWARTVWGHWRVSFWGDEI